LETWAPALQRIAEEALAGTAPQAELKEAPPPAAEPEPEARRSGIFGWSYDRR
jgi:hypothetical protein